MIIEGKLYKLTPIDDHSLLFDLELLRDIGGKNPRQEFKIAAYGVSLENAIKRVAMYATNKKLNDEAVELNAFLKTFKENLDDGRRDIGAFIS